MVIRKAGKEILVSTQAAGDNVETAIAIDSKGAFVVTWSNSKGDSDQAGVLAQRFDTKGRPIGEAILVNTDENKSQSVSDIAMDAQGNFAISWTTYASSDANIGVRRFSANGEPLDRLEYSPVNAYTEGLQDRTSVAMNASGDHVVIWRSEPTRNTSGRYGFYGQRFLANGTPMGEEITISAAERTVFYSDVAMYDDGSFVAVWVQDSIVYGQRYTSAGSPLGRFQVTEDTSKLSYSPAIATTPDGGFVVAWEKDNGDDDGEEDIVVRRFNASGRPLSKEILVNTFTAGEQICPSIAADQFGNFVVAWESDDQDGDGTGIYARRFALDGRPLSDEFLVNTTTQDSQYEPDVAMRSNGDFVITWDGYVTDRNQAFAQRFELASAIAVDKRNIKAKEGQNALLTLSRSDETHLRSQVTVDVIGGTATQGKDYRFSKPINVTFKPGQTEQTIRVPILKDSLIEKKETVLLEISEKDRAYLDKGTRAKLTILDVPSKSRSQSMDTLLGDEQVAVGKQALTMEPVRSGGSRQPLFTSAEREPVFAQTFDINPFTGTGSQSWGHYAPDAASLVAPTPLSETPFVVSSSFI